MANARSAYGSVEGTGSAINVSIGFTPKYVKVYNHDDAGGAAPSMEWWTGMTDGHSLKNTTDTQAKVTSNGISEYDGTSTASPGFTIGADTDVNASGETIFYIALGED